MQEVWKPIAEYSGLYEVSNLGNVRRLEYTDQIGRKKQTKVLHPSHKENGYYHVVLIKNREKKYYSVHRLVAAAFVDNPNNYPIINHKDEDMNNNNADNLEWCTYTYNNRYGTARIRTAITKGTPVKMLDADGNEIARFYSMSEASRQTGIATSSINSSVKNNRPVKQYKWEVV